MILYILSLFQVSRKRRRKKPDIGRKSKATKNSIRSRNRKQESTASNSTSSNEQTSDIARKQLLHNLCNNTVKKYVAFKKIEIKVFLKKLPTAANNNLKFNLIKIKKYM